MSDVGSTDQVSVESGGRVLSGIGVSEDRLTGVMARHAPESVPAETPEVPDTPQGGTDGTENPQRVDATPAETAARTKRGPKRFDALVGEREAAEREKEAVTRERDELKARLAALEARPAQTALVPHVEPPKPDETRAKPSEDEIGTKYQTYADFVEDLSDWKAEQRLNQLDLDARIRSRIEADRASRSFQDTQSQIRDRALKVYPDFDTVLTSGPGASIVLGSTVQQGDDRIRYIATLPNAEHIQYAICHNADVARQIAAMPDYQFGKFVDTLAPSSGAVASPASTPTSVIPPKPYQPVGTGSSTTAVPSSDLTKKAGYDFDKSGYREKRRAELGRGR